MEMADIGSLIGGFAETRLGLEERDFQREQARRKARLDILSAALPSITDPTLKAEALAMAEEFATGKTGKGGKRAQGGGLSEIFGKLIGTGAQDVGQGTKLQEFMTRPREGIVRPPKTGAVELPEVPGVFPPETRRVPLPGVSETVRGPFPTMEEQQRQRAAGIRGEAFARGGAEGEVKEETARRRREQIQQDPRFRALTPQQQFEVLYPEISIPASADIAVSVPGTVPGSWLRTQPGFETADESQQYHITRSRGGTGPVVSAYPASATTTGLKETWWSDPDSSTGFTRAYQNPATGRFHSVTRDLMPPPAWVPTTATSNTVRFVQQADGSYVATPVTTTTTRGRVLPGTAPRLAGPGAQSRTSLPAVPGTPVGVQPGQVVGHARVVTPKNHQDYLALLQAKEALDQLYEMGAGLIEGEGPRARIGGLFHRGKAALGLDPLAATFNQRRDALRSVLARVVGRDVGNLAIQEQNWAVSNAPRLGMTQTEFELARSQVGALLDRRMDELREFIETGKLPAAQAAAPSPKPAKPAAEKGIPEPPARLKKFKRPVPPLPPSLR